MRISPLTAYSKANLQPKNPSFGKFTDANADEIAQGLVKSGNLNKGDYNILKNTDIIHISSQGDTLQSKINNKALEGVADEYIEILEDWAKPERLKNAHEKRKLVALASGVEAMLQAMHNDSNPKPEKTGEGGINERLKQELDIFFNRAF